MTGKVLIFPEIIDNQEAIDYVDNWEPKTNTKLRIDEYNRQQRFEV